MWDVPPEFEPGTCMGRLVSSPLATSEAPPRARLWRYVGAVALVLLTLEARVLIGSSIEGPALIVLTVPIILSAYLGGVGPGLVATATAFVGASYYLLPPIHSFFVASGSDRWQ